MEHYRSVLPDSPFRAYGDVLAAKTEEVDVNGVKKLALFVQIEPTDDLIAMNKARQKLYTSIEISPKFADTGRAYQDGLAVTDSPASLGTEMLTFSAQNPDASPLKARKSKPDIPLFAWILVNQRELMENVDRSKTAVAFEADVLDNSKVDLSIKLPLTERVIVKRQDDGNLVVSHPPEPVVDDDPFTMPGLELWTADGEFITRWEQP